ncbi:MFS transporter [Sphingomonas sp. MMS24-J13]|uniref:MFS transporter n=1 Tax=Sphingomonas sp. MMS24-J13 TaxID=3238686 RepID=UPI00384A51E9
MSAPDPAIRQARLIALVTAGVMFMTGLDGTVIVTALPQMARDFGVRPTALSSSIIIYILVSAAMLPVSSWIAERYGTRRVLMIAIAGFTLSSILCGLVGSLTPFLAARALQAGFASLMVPVGNLVLLRVTPKRFLVQALAISTTPGLIAPVVGPPLGGLITSFLSWPWVFFINVPLGLFGLVAAYRLIPQLYAEKKAPFDVASFVLTAGALCALIFGLDRLSAIDSDRRLAGIIVLLGLALAAYAWRHARTAEHSLMPLDALRHESFFTATITAGNFMRVPFNAQGFVLPLMLQIGLGLSPFQAGMLLLAQNAGDVVLKPVASKALHRMGFRMALTSGSVTMGLSLAACALLDTHTPFVILLLILFVVGMARSIPFTAMMSISFADLTETEMGGANVLNNLANALASAVGISLSALILNLLSSGAAHPDLGAFRIAMLVLGAIALGGAPLWARLSDQAGAEVTRRALPHADMV